MLTKKLAENILDEFQNISNEFSIFQNANNLNCFEGCGKCCFKSDITCTPMELLPLALELLERGEAEKFYDVALGKQEERCLFLEVHDEEKGLGRCQEYKFRPLVCRSFGVAARHGKKNNVEYSVCKLLKENKKDAYEALVAKNKNLADLPFLETLRSRLSTIDPGFLQQTEYPINKSLVLILEKVLTYNLFLETDKS